MREIAVPRLNSNDDTCLLVEWSYPAGADVDAHAVIAVVETSKAAADICSDDAGIIHPIAEPGAECRVGEVIGYVFGDARERQEFLAAQPNGQSTTDGSAGPAPVLTDAARRLSERVGVSPDRLRALGKRIIREADVEALVGAPPADDAALPPRQRAIAKVVSRSHRTIPDAFVAMKVRCDELLELLRERNAKDDRMVGVPEVAIAVLAGLKPAFPTFFASVEDDDRLILPPTRTDIGVTIDVGTGLFVPVVRDAGALTAGEIADRLMEFRVKALRAAFREADLSAGQLTVSLNTDAEVLFAIPIILPPQVCVLAIGSAQPELTLDGQGQIRQHTSVTVGLSYDHRVINGRDAVEFLTAFKQAMRRPREVPL